MITQFDTSTHLDDDPTLMLNTVCYTWDTDNQIWQGPEGVEYQRIYIPANANCWIGLTDRSWTEDSINTLYLNVNGQNETLGFVRSHKTGYWGTTGVATSCPSDDATKKCLNYPDDQNCFEIKFKDAFPTNNVKKLTMSSHKPIQKAKVSTITPIRRTS